jgi:hypothetical protein
MVAAEGPRALRSRRHRSSACLLAAGYGEARRLQSGPAQGEGKAGDPGVAAVHVEGDAGPFGSGSGSGRVQSRVTLEWPSCSIVPESGDSGVAVMRGECEAG